MIKTKIISDAGKRGAIRHEGYGREGHAIASKTAHELLCHMQGLGGTAAVASGQHFSPRSQGRNHDLTHGFDCRRAFSQTLNRRDARVQGCGDSSLDCSRFSFHLNPPSRSCWRLNNAYSMCTTLMQSRDEVYHPTRVLSTTDQA